MDSKVWVLIYPHISQDEIDKTTNIKNYMPTSFFIIDSQYNLLESLHYGSSRILDEKQVKNLRPDIWDMHINNSRLYLSLLLYPSYLHMYCYSMKVDIASNQSKSTHFIILQDHQNVIK